MAKETLTFDYWPERVDGPNEERHILAGDYRDRDYLTRFDGLTLYANDLSYQENHSKSAPDWSMGVQARDSNNRVILEWKGEPSEDIKRALLENRILYGAILARDEERHGI